MFCMEVAAHKCAACKRDFCDRCISVQLHTDALRERVGLSGLDGSGVDAYCVDKECFSAFREGPQRLWLPSEYTVTKTGTRVLEGILRTEAASVGAAAARRPSQASPPLTAHPDDGDVVDGCAGDDDDPVVLDGVAPVGERFNWGTPRGSVCTEKVVHLILTGE